MRGPLILLAVGIICILFLVVGCDETADPVPTRTWHGNGVYTKIVTVENQRFLVFFTPEGGIAALPFPDPARE